MENIKIMLVFIFVSSNFHNKEKKGQWVSGWVGGWGQGSNKLYEASGDYIYQVSGEGHSKRSEGNKWNKTFLR